MTKQEAKDKILTSLHMDALEPKAIRFILEIIENIECPDAEFSGADNKENTDG